MASSARAAYRRMLTSTPLSIWQAALLWLAPAASPLPTTPPTESEIGAYFEPLVGGPRWLPLHVVVVADGMRFDFLPDAPQEPSTALALLTGGGTPGTVRCRPARPQSRGTRTVLLGTSAKSAADLEAFALSYPTSLSLGRNDCWSFACNLRRFACDDKGG